MPQSNLSRRHKGAVVVNRPSSSAFALRRALGGGWRVVRARNLPEVVANYSSIVNWGCSTLRTAVNFNTPGAVKNACCKLTFAVLSYGQPWALPATTDRATAAAWLAFKGEKVMCRTVINGHSGKGIVVAREAAQLVNAPLYTLYIRKTAEFRAHVFCGNVIALQQKRKRNGACEGFDPLIRTHGTGWVYATNNIDYQVLPPDWALAVSEAVDVCGLDFGAVDFIIQKDTGKLHVLEVNTAPGIASTTALAAYVKAIKESVARHRLEVS